MTNAAEATRSLVIERTVKHPPEKVWRALTEVPLLDEWLLKSDFQPVVGHQFTFRAEPSPHWDGLVRGEVLTVEPPAKLAYRWLEWVVTWTLTPTADGTHLRMEQAGFTAEQDQALAGARFGWTRFLDGLEGLLARA